MLQPSLYPSLPYGPQDTLADTLAYILSCSIFYSRACTLAYPIAPKIRLADTLACILSYSTCYSRACTLAYPMAPKIR